MPKRKSKTKDHIKIDGKSYDLAYKNLNKTDAKAWAKKLRDQGNSARVKKVGKKYGVYVN